jgi:hypothetical protein
MCNFNVYKYNNSVCQNVSKILPKSPIKQKALLKKIIQLLVKKMNAFSISRVKFYEKLSYL